MRRRWSLRGVAAVAAAFGLAAVALPTARAQPPQGPDARALLDNPASPQGYDRLLRDYLVRVPAEDGRVATAFDYDRLAENPLQDQMRADLRDRFLNAHPEGMDDATRTAWALNAYNFLIIDTVMEHYRTADGARLGSISDIGKGDFAVFDDPWFEVRGTAYSLNSFEKHFLFRDVDRTAKHIPAGLDPRLHFALVCAARGCPPLWPRPFQPESLDEDLTAVTRNALRSPHHLRVEGRVVHVSKIFEWYEPDFGAYGGVSAFLEQFAPPDVKQILADKANRAKPMTDIEWDWTLNAP